MKRGHQSRARSRRLGPRLMPMKCFQRRQRAVNYGREIQQLWRRNLTSLSNSSGINVYISSSGTSALSIGIGGGLFQGQGPRAWECLAWRATRQQGDLEMMIWLVD